MDLYVAWKRLNLSLLFHNFPGKMNGVLFIFFDNFQTV